MRTGEACVDPFDTPTLQQSVIIAGSLARRPTAIGSRVADQHMLRSWTGMSWAIRNTSVVCTARARHRTSTQKTSKTASRMKADKSTLILPILLITVGVGWLLTTLGVAPGIDWIWTLGLAIVGLLAFVLGGLDKVTVVVGPLFIITSCLSVLRQTERLPFNVEVPVLVILSGVLLLIARLPAIPLPKWAAEEPAG